MTRKEAAAREIVEQSRHALTQEPIIIIDPEGGSVTGETRRESHTAIQKEAAARRRVILSILTERGQLTAREVAAELHRRGVTPSDERNYAAPRLTELREAGKVTVTGKKICNRTGRSVALWAVQQEVT